MEINNLRAYLLQIGMQCKDFCVMIDVNPSHLSQIINGRAYPSRRLARDIYNATNGVINLPTRPRKAKQEKEKQQEDLK